jgi:hypothetical protein
VWDWRGGGGVGIGRGRRSCLDGWGLRKGMMKNRAGHLS